MKKINYTMPYNTEYEGRMLWMAHNLYNVKDLEWPYELKQLIHKMTNPIMNYSCWCRFANDFLSAISEMLVLSEDFSKDEDGVLYEDFAV